MIKKMTINDYEEIRSLWLRIKGFVIRNIDDSYEGIDRFLKRNPNTCVVAVEEGKIVGSILCGHDGRRACMYHVCVDPDYRLKGIGKSMVSFALDSLIRENVSNVTIIAFTKNDVGNLFWKELGWNIRQDVNTYEISINEKNTTTVIDN